MNGYRGHDDRGTVLIITVVTMTLLAFGVLALAGTVKRLMDASLAEALSAEQRLASQTTASVLDAWMADQEDSDAISNAGAGRVWMTPIGEQPCPSTTLNRNICWRVGDVTEVPIADPTLRGGEAQREALDVTILIATGCHTDTIDDCQQVITGSRRYERSVSFQYQLHYDTNFLAEGALDGPDGEADPADCLTPTPIDPALCDRPNSILDGPDGIADPADCLTSTPIDPTLCDGPTGIVFTSEDTLNGPLRTTQREVLYCGEPTFYRVEVSGNEPAVPSSPLQAADTSCPTDPQWLNEDGNIITPSPALPDLLNNGALIYGGNLDLPDLDASGYSETLLCDVVNHPSAVVSDCFAPDDLVNPVNIGNGAIISARTGRDITIHELVLDGSATVYAAGDIIICGDIEARGTNLAGGPNVIALVTEGDVILDPSGQPSLCGQDVIPALTELSASHDISLTNVAVLAPEGAIYARNWHLPHAPAPAVGPTLTIEGSIAAKHLGLYGEPDPATGTVIAGWAKNFTYPNDFWLARPPWWPGYDGNEWA